MLTSADLFAASERLTGRANAYEQDAERRRRAAGDLRAAAADVERAWKSATARTFASDLAGLRERLDSDATLIAGAAETARALARSAHDIATMLRTAEVRIDNLDDEQRSVQRLASDATPEHTPTFAARLRSIDSELRHLESSRGQYEQAWIDAGRAAAAALRAISVPFDIAATLAFAPALHDLRAQSYVLAHVLDLPATFGNVDGIPIALRIAANRQRMEADFAAAEPGSDEYNRLKAMLGTVRGPDGPVARQFLVYDPSGDGKYAEVFGNVTTAANVAIYVPGTGADISNWRGYSISRDETFENRVVLGARDNLTPIRVVARKDRPTLTITGLTACAPGELYEQPAPRTTAPSE
jgi:hypothetical protein